MAMQAAEFRPLGAPRSSLRRQRRSYFQTALRQFIANQIPGPARSAASRRRLGFCHAKVTQREKSKGAASLQPVPPDNSSRARSQSGRRSDYAANRS